jgi:hypothetical protein
MKFIKFEILISQGRFPASKDWQRIQSDIVKAIKSVQWPPGSGKFVLHDQSGKKRGQGSGVKPIKEAFCEALKRAGWSLETRLPIAARKKPGPVDATLPVGSKIFAVEWETGNISSSHRALDKMALGIITKVLIGGVLVLPTRSMYYYLTDRVGNYEEIEPYFALWRSLQCDEGLLAIAVVEHDAARKDVPRIPKGTNGRALV